MSDCQKKEKLIKYNTIDLGDYYYYKKSVWCLERLQWGLGNCESVRQADCVEMMDCHGDPLVQECRFTRVGGAQRCSPADLGDKLVRLICHYYYWLYQGGSSWIGSIH